MWILQDIFSEKDKELIILFNFLARTSFTEVTLQKPLSYCQLESMHRSLFMGHKGNYSIFLEAKNQENWFKSKTYINVRLKAEKQSCIDLLIPS